MTMTAIPVASPYGRVRAATALLGISSSQHAGNLAQFSAHAGSRHDSAACHSCGSAGETMLSGRRFRGVIHRLRAFQHWQAFAGERSLQSLQLDHGMSRASAETVSPSLMTSRSPGTSSRVASGAARRLAQRWPRVQPWPQSGKCLSARPSCTKRESHSTGRS